MGKLTGKTALITGASQGIGEGIARTFARHGANLILLDISDEIEKLADELAGRGHRCTAVHADVRDFASVKEAVMRAKQIEGKIDILVNNAGIFTSETIETVTEADWERVMDTNLKSMVFASQWFASYNREHGTGGSIVNIASVSSVTYIPHNLLYNISKAGVVTLTKTLARDLGPSNIRVNAVGPGSIPTDLNAALYADKQREIDLCNKIPLGRRGTKDDIANCVLFLAADESSYLTGQVIFAEGGWLLA